MIVEPIHDPLPPSKILADKAWWGGAATISDVNRIDTRVYNDIDDAAKKVPRIPLEKWSTLSANDRDDFCKKYVYKTLLCPLHYLWVDPRNREAARIRQRNGDLWNTSSVCASICNKNIGWVSSLGEQDMKAFCKRHKCPMVNMLTGYNCGGTIAQPCANKGASLCLFSGGTRFSSIETCIGEHFKERGWATPVDTKALNDVPPQLRPIYAAGGLLVTVYIEPREDQKHVLEHMLMAPNLRHDQQFKGCEFTVIDCILSLKQSLAANEPMILGMLRAKSSDNDEHVPSMNSIMDIDVRDTLSRVRSTAGVEGVKRLMNAVIGLSSGLLQGAATDASKLLSFERLFTTHSLMTGFDNMRGLTHNLLRAFGVMSRCLLNDEEITYINLPLIIELIKPPSRIAVTTDAGGISRYLDQYVSMCFYIVMCVTSTSCRLIMLGGCLAACATVQNLQTQTMNKVTDHGPLLQALGGRDAVQQGGKHPISLANAKWKAQATELLEIEHRVIRPGSRETDEKRRARAFCLLFGYCKVEYLREVVDGTGTD